VNPASVYYDETGKETTAIPVSGIHKAYYKTGELCVETPYENGKINGLRRIYYKNQKVSFQIPYIDNKINGVVFYFDSNSVLLAEKFYLDSLQHGSSKSYFTNGNVQTEEKYVNGKKNGTVVNYTEDGKVWIATQYKDDKKNGVQKMFYPNGNLQSEHEFKDDVGNGKFKVYDDKGVLLSESAEIDGLTNGEAKYYHNGALFMTSSFINGKKEGVEKIYQANGALLLETPYSAGKKNGIQTYYNNGTAFTKIKYVNNAKDVAFEKEQEKIRKKEIRQAALNEFGVTLVQGLQQTSAQLDYQRNPNSQTLSNYLNVVANNSMKDGKEAIKDNNTVLNGASANYGNSESYAATNSGNSQTAAVCSKNAKLAWEESDEYRDYVQKNPSCNKKAYIAQRKQAELLLEHCKCCSTNEDINVLNSTISTLTKRINDMPDCNFQFADPGPPKQQNYEVVPMSPPSKGDNGGKATKAK
jgi:antitoxin component YwqK of YwqJK toxin-antitoxin module